MGKGKREERGEQILKTREHKEGHYEVQDGEMGKVYSWCPESVEFECKCGERATFTRLETICERCATDHTARVLEVLSSQRPDDETTHPWRYDEDSKVDEKDPILWA